jgi:hypothetical protein
MQGFKGSVAKCVTAATVAWLGGAARAAPAAATPEPPVMAAAELRVGVERLAKLCVEHSARVDPLRAQDELLRERQRVIGALALLRADTSLAGRRRGQLLRLSDGVSAFIERIDSIRTGSAASNGWNEVYRDSEALAAQVSFVSTALSADLADGGRATLVDLLTRAAATALRVGKLNFAAAAGEPVGAARPPEGAHVPLGGTARSAEGALVSKGIEVDLQQSLGEFSAALAAISAHQLPDQRMQDDLELARNQWVLFRAALNDNGRVKDARRLPHVATTADRIAQSLLAIAQRAMRQGAVEATARRA